MEQAIVEAEKYKATIEKPSGMNETMPIKLLNCDLACDESFNAQKYPIVEGGVRGAVLGNPRVFNDNQGLNLPHLDQSSSDSRDSSVGRQVVGNGLSDDDFFHLTCHIDQGLKKKIENGEFVDLDKLLPKDNSFQGRLSYSNETKLEWVQSEGNTYLVPAKNTSRVNCFRRWEQAFRMYATIYCTKNPSRSREIWQYVSIINTASMSYNWDTVYNYDIVFRQLMEFNPNRSWAVTYNQMWNLSMTTPLTHNNQGGRRSFGGTSSNFQYPKAGNSSGNKKKIDYCWSFNKGVKCKFGKKCKFIERCSYCDEASHGVVNCSKLDKKDKDSTKGHKGRSSQ